jgi:dTDP-4-amino-4,6-dideoxygalactose transaminase
MFGNERELVDEAFDSNYIAPCGPMVERFEETFAEKTGVAHTCALSSCSAALDLLFHDLGVVAGDIVFCSNLTFVASIAPAVQRGATPVFIGSDVSTWTMSPDVLEEALHDARRLGKLPKVVIAVDLYGQCCDYECLEKVCQQFDVPLIVDAAEALGAVYYGLLRPLSGRNDECKKGGRNDECKKGVATAGLKVLPSNLQPLRGCKNKMRQAGDAGWAGVYSFNGNKIITSSGGGMLVSRDEALVRRACKRSQQSRDAKVWYEHSELGYNYRMSNIVAAIGLGQLLNLDQIVARKRAIFELYEQLLTDVSAVEWMPEADYGRCNRWLSVAMLESGTPDSAITHSGEPSAAVMELIKSLESENIEARPIWKPMHLQPVFKGCRVYGEKNDENIFRRGICLPSGTGISEVDVTRIAEIIRGALRF